MITLVFGPMFSGKTTYLLAFERRFHYSKQNVCLVKWSKDNRYTDEPKLITHDGQSNTNHSCTHVLSVESLSQIPQDIIDQHEAFCIDEGQFFPDLADWCKKFGTSKQIVIAALSGDYRQKCFQSISEIIGICDTITHIKSICVKCGQDAPFTSRLTGDQEQTLIGSDDIYQPRCRACFE